MRMNLIEKILAAHAGLKEVRPGQIVTASVDVALANELSGIAAIEEFRRVGATKVWNPEGIVVVPDHFTPAKDIRTAEICKKLREWVWEQEIPHYFEVGRGGIEHTVLPDEGLTLPGQLIIGGDSHTVTYGAVGAFACGVGSTDLAAAWITGEIWLKVPDSIRLVFEGRPGRHCFAKDLILFAVKNLSVEGARYKCVKYEGSAVKALHMTGRFTMCNMTAEMGGKCGYIEPDETTMEYLRSTPARDRKFAPLRDDPGTPFGETREFDVEGLEPQVSCPPSPDQVVPVSAVPKVRLDQVFIGSCTNGRIEDLRLAAEILRGRKVHPRTRLIVVPGSQRVYLQALKEGIIETFVVAGGAVSTPTCGACVGGHMGVIADGESCLSTTNRNFVGRMGHVNAKTFLANPAVAAASAVAGTIVHPDSVLTPSRVAVP
ncbi:MAG: 3-isopropylmalate dehydratase large subunit [Planctomycetes bacterium]|nr:3-isopropylmalate dehydratase large subunit [Planctomycetota bacterium]